MTEAFAILDHGTPLIGLCAIVGLILYLNRQWRPIIRAYLEAKCLAQNTYMKVDDEPDKPGRLYAPLHDDSDDL